MSNKNRAVDSKEQLKKAINKTSTFLNEKKDKTYQSFNKTKNSLIHKTNEISQKGKKAYQKVYNYSIEKREQILLITQEKRESLKVSYLNYKEKATNKYNEVKENTEIFINDSKRDLNKNLNNYNQKIKNSWTETKIRINDFRLSKKPKEPDSIELCLYWTERIKGQGLFLPGTRLYKSLESSQRYLRELKKINFKANKHILDGISLTLEKYEELIKEPIKTEKIYQLMRKIESVIPDYTKAIHEMYDEAVGLKCTNTDIHIDALNNQLKISGYLNEKIEDND